VTTRWPKDTPVLRRAMVESLWSYSEGPGVRAIGSWRFDFEAAVWIPKLKPTDDGTTSASALELAPRVRDDFVPNRPTE
jgi:hypothetical protein